MFDFCSNLVKVDYFESYKSTLEELEERLKKSASDEFSNQLIELSSKLKEYKMSELKSKREASLATEKEEYYQRMTRQYLEQIKSLERELAEWSMKYAKRVTLILFQEEFWHQRYKDQVKLIFQSSPANENNETQEQEIKGGNYIGEMSERMAELKELRETVRILKEEMFTKDDRIVALEKAIQNKKFDKEGHQEIVNSIQNEEIEKIKSAAHKTITMLQEILEDKNKQLDRKDKQLEILRKETLLHKEKDSEEIKNLNEMLFV